MSFRISALLVAGLLFAGAVVGGVAVVRIPDLSRSLPRNRLFGALVGLLALVWAGYHVHSMLEGGLTRFRVLIPLLAAVVGVLAFFFLDYLFARAVGGLLVLWMNSLLHTLFAADVRARPVLAVLCYLIGIAGMVLVVSPWRFRDVLEAVAKAPRARRIWVSICAGCGALFLVFALIG